MKKDKQIRADDSNSEHTEEAELQDALWDALEEPSMVDPTEENNPAQVPSIATSSAGPRHQYTVTALDGAPVKEKSDPRLSSGAGPSNVRISMPAGHRSLSIGTRSGSGSVANSDWSLGMAKLQHVGMSPDNAHKTMMDPNLAKFSISDPEKAKRLWGNRQACAKYRKRKADQIAERKTQIKTLQTEKINLVATIEVCISFNTNLVVDMTGTELYDQLAVTVYKEVPPFSISDI